MDGSPGKSVSALRRDPLAVLISPVLPDRPRPGALPGRFFSAVS
jgi:hypothetical protein